MIELKKSTTDAMKTAKRAIKKTTEATGDLVGNKIADNIKSVKKIIITESFRSS